MSTCSACLAGMFRRFAGVSVALLLLVQPWAVAAPQAPDGRGASGYTALSETPHHADPDHAAANAGGETSNLDVGELAPPGAEAIPDGEILVQAPIAGQTWTLRLWPHSVRDPHEYRIIEQGADGRLRPVTAGPVRTVRGEVLEAPGARVVGSVMPEGLSALVQFADGSRHWIEPASSTGGSQPAPVEHVIAADGGPWTPWRCGNGDEPPPADLAVDAGGIAGGGPCVAQLACDADREFFVAYGSTANVEARINSIVNLVNFQYESQAEITHVITTIIVRTAEPDPYSSNDSATLLAQFRNEWLINQGGVPRDLAKLFTGRAISNGVVGQAWTIGAVCTNSAYCFSWSDFAGSTACATDVAAHELGHLWGAAHCACDNPPSTMNAQILCANTFAPISIAEIIAHRTTRTCLNCGGAPPNDACAAAISIGDGAFPFSTVNATTDGPNEPSACNFFSYTQVGNDVWFRYTASCTGAATASVCSSTYDTKLAVYVGNACPTAASAIACNDDFCGNGGLRSQVTFAATAGQQYLIRIGGYTGETGSGTLQMACAPTNLPNDHCQDATPVSEGVINFSTVGATTDGPSEPGVCTFFGDAQVGSDVWYLYTPSCSGSATVSLCGSAYDTKVAIYAGAACPTQSAAIACNDDFCGSPLRQSEVTFVVLAGQPYLIRIGGFNGLTGTGTMSITCTAVVPDNDACTAAITVTDGAYSYFTVGATTDGPDEPDACLHAGQSQIDNDIWYRYVAPCNGQVTFDICESTFDTRIAAYAGSECPDDESALACVDDSCGPTALQSALVLDISAGGEYLIRVGAYGGQVGSGTLVVSTLGLPPTLLLHPQSTSACLGGSAFFAVVANGAPPLSYQWRRDGVDIPGANGPTLIVSPVDANSTGQYSVLVSDACGATLSDSATLSIIAPPVVTTQPVGQNVCPGAGLTLTVGASGTPPLGYQWSRNLVDIPGATGPSYTIVSATPGDAGSYRCAVSNLCGTAVSNAAVVGVRQNVGFSSQPASRAVCPGAPTTFSVTATGTGPFSYQWQRNGVNIPLATNSSYTISAVTPDDAGGYRCVVTNICGSATSNTATLTVNTPVGILQQPQAQSVCSGAPATFSVVVSGTAPLSYQWQRNTVNIPGATSPTFSIAVVAPSDAGSYRCVVSNACGSQTSTAAVLTVEACGCAAAAADTDCNGVVDFFDIDPFLLALFDPAGYAAAYCGGDPCAADVDCSGIIDFFDIDAFLTCVFGGCLACP